MALYAMNRGGLAQARYLIKAAKGYGLNSNWRDQPMAADAKERWWREYALVRTTRWSLGLTDGATEETIARSPTRMRG